MARLVKNIRYQRRVIFDKGKFDDWCVYVVERNGHRKAPLDVEYFHDLKMIALGYPDDKVYRDFLKIYELTTSSVEATVIQAIDNIVKTYKQDDQELIEQWFTVLYAGMIAEENKEKAILKKRVKRLGMHQVLMEDIPVQEAANFSKGKSWRELDKIMLEKGF